MTLLELLWWGRFAISRHLAVTCTWHRHKPGVNTVLGARGGGEGEGEGGGEGEGEGEGKGKGKGGSQQAFLSLLPRHS